MPSGIHHIIEHQMRKWEFETAARRNAAAAGATEKRLRPSITLARQIGAGGGVVARGIGKKLGLPVFDREILETIGHEAHIRDRLLDLLDEKDRSAAEIWVEGLLRGRLADKGDYLRALAHTVFSVTTQESTILIGRGLNFMLGHDGVPHLHLRIVAPLEQRIRAVQARRGISAREALALIEHTDADRAGFVRHHYHREIEDPQEYDLVLNAASLTPEDCIDIAVEAHRRVVGHSVGTA